MTVILPTVLVEELDSMADEINAARRPHPKATRASLIREALETVKRHKLPPYDGP